jgi:hypothetical protein
MSVARMIAPRPRKSDQQRPPGQFNLGTSNWWGGPVYVDGFESRRAPTPYQLVERYKTLVFAMAGRNRDAVSRLPIRLYVDGSRAQGGRPRSACDPIRVGRSAAERFVRNGMVSGAAVDRVYEVRNHKMLDVLDRPDPDGIFDRKALIGFLTLSMDILGSAYLVPDGNGWDRATGARGTNAPECLWVLYSQYVYGLPRPSDPRVEYWQYFAERIPFASAIWFRQSVSLRQPYASGYSPAYAGDMYQDQEQRMVAIADQLLGMGPRPNVVVSSKDPMMPMGVDAKERLRADLNRKQAGPNAGGALVTDGSIEVTPINQPPADSSWKDLSEYDRNCLASIFGQPPTFYTTDTNLANLQAADEQHARFGVEPRGWAIAGKLTRFVQEFDPRLFFAFDDAIQEDSESKEKVISMRLASGRTVINQENEEDRWPPVKWGDEPWLPSTLKQPSMMQAEHEQGLATAKAGIEQGQAKAENESKLTKFQTTETDTEERALVERARWLIGEIEGRRAG